MARLELRGVAKTYPGGIVAADGVDLDVEAGELFVVVGPSGSGKSTLLRLVAGLESLDAGTITLDGRRIDGLAPAARDVAMVFQDQVLYPHLDVFENMAFGLRARRVARAEVEARVGAIASALGLADCLGRAPGTLSGGQRRRVALGRTLVLRPRLFLLDEPLSGLDAPLRASTRAELAELNRATDVTMVMVTHDQADALALGDRVAVVDRGGVLQVGRPLDLYAQPRDRFVARFLGQPAMNLLPCVVASNDRGVSIRFVGVGDKIPWTAPPEAPWARTLAGLGAAEVEVGLRPEQVAIRPDRAVEGTPTGPSYPATVRRLEPLGHETIAHLRLGPHDVTSRVPANAPDRAGDRVRLTLDLDRAAWFDPSTGVRLA